MQRSFYVGALVLSLAGTPILLARPEAQETKESTANPTIRLRADVQRAIQNGNPTEAELATLQKAFATLREARTARAQGRSVDRQQVLNALNDAEKVFQSDSFKAADRQALQHDVQELRKQHEK